MQKVMKTCVIIRIMVGESGRDAYECGIDALGMFEKAQSWFRESIKIVWQSKEALENAIG